jgi:geranylgeranylglycerol-phosphate geranylgeranyltransferase
VTGKAAAAWALARPFTLLAPAVGMVSGSLVALGTLRGKGTEDGALLADAAPAIALGALMAAALNVASNAVNQIFDLAIDRVNKPDRPLPSGALSIGQAWAVTAVAAVAALALAWALNPTTLGIVAFTALVVYAYSGPPFRTKRFWWAANPTIAIPRGSLLFVAGWTAVDGDARLGSMLLWVMAAMYGLFVLGAATTKDYADMKGDGAEGCVTLPIRFGVRRSVWIIAPFLVLPWLLLPIGVLAHGNRSVQGWFHAGLGAGLALWGAWVVRLLLRDPDALTSGKEHPSWRHMYLMMVGSQVGVAAGFWLPR